MDMDLMLRRGLLAIAIATVLATAMLLVSEASYQRATLSMLALEEVSRSRLLIQQVMRRALDAETGQRGYLLTSRQDYLAPFDEAREDTADLLTALSTYYTRTGDDKSLALSTQLSQVTAEKLSELTTTIGLHDSGKDQTWRELMLTDIGKEKMDRVRTITEQLLAVELGKFDRHRSEVSDTLFLNRVGVAGLAVLGFAVVLLFLLQTSRLNKALAERRRAIETERDRLEIEVQRRTADLTALAKGLQSAQEEERGRLARELHDELGAVLTAAKLDGARLKSKWPDIPAAAAERLREMVGHIGEGIALKRRIIEDLLPSSLKNLGLVPALEILTREFSERAEVKVTTHLGAVQLAPEVELTIYRMVQEALTNVAKYAQATQVHVELTEEHNQVRAEVRDDGVGFDTSSPRLSAHGLMGMRYRIEADGGQFSLISAPGEGTSVVATLASPADLPGAHATLRGNPA